MKRSVVIYDTDKSFLYVMSVIFKRHNFNVIASSRIDEVVAGLKDSSVKAVFISIDIKFRGKDGITICKSLNKAYQGRIPIIMTSNVATEENVIRSVQAGAMEFVLKPPQEQSVIKKTLYAMSLGNTKFIVPNNLKDLNFKEGMTLPEMIQIVIQEADEIRGMPAAVAKIIEVSQNQKTGAAAMEKAIESDASIAAMVLKLANSAFYKGQSPIKTIKKAVIRIGFDECRKLVLGISVFKLFGNEQKNFGFNRGHYWLHSITTAVLAEWLCCKAGTNNDADAFMVGLLHDFGKLLLDDYLSEHFQKSLQICSINDLRLFEAENEVFERDHAGVTKAIMTKWNFPEHMGEAVGRHHHPPTLNKDVADAPPELSDAIFLANQMAKASMLGNGGDYFATPVPKHVWDAFKVKDGEFVIDDVKSCYKKIEDFLGFLEISEKDLGIPIQFPANKGLVLVIVNYDSDYTLLVFFLVCQGYTPHIIKPTQEIPEDDYAVIFMFVHDKENTNERFKVLAIEQPNAKTFIIPNEVGYTASLAPSNIIVLEGQINYYHILTALNKSNA